MLLRDQRLGIQINLYGFWLMLRSPQLMLRARTFLSIKKKYLMFTSSRLLSNALTCSGMLNKLGTRVIDY